MDQIYKPFDRQASSKICLKDYFQQYSELIKSSICHETHEIDKQTDDEIFQLMGTNRLEAKVHLKHYCSIENLTLSTEISKETGEKQEYINIPENLDNISLETIKMLKILSKETLLKALRNQNGIPIKYERDKKHDKNNLKMPDINAGEEFLVYVRVYEPFKSYPRSLKYKMGLPALKLKNVISILGCQTLYELRQKIMCQSDLSITKETSKNPNQKPGPMAKDIYKSGFFYIEDTFYNDTSLPTNIDYSKIILEWASTRDIGPFKVATMDSKINSLSTKFGFPWVYQHQGCCEHLIVFTDARFVERNSLDHCVAILNQYHEVSYDQYINTICHIACHYTEI
ncbi:snRNA-activating protein complex subunit 3 isoform X2 [Solenopsis invicta]|uniref:snRNA-activating protein complex subunit 3 isoform X2 n=1 Tax=Solenopsis invicta TaxID=13686 RepID=UPI00193CD51A|nr:snRNA-activating protein complex subunit 3 isoform X2 [Solenopsis invicta]